MLKRIWSGWLSVDWFFDYFICLKIKTTLSTLRVQLFPSVKCISTALSHRNIIATGAWGFASNTKESPQVTPCQNPLRLWIHPYRHRQSHGSNEKRWLTQSVEKGQGHCTTQLKTYVRKTFPEGNWKGFFLYILGIF